MLHHAASDLLADGITATVLDGHLDDPGPSALALRMMGGVHALVLQGDAPRVAPYFPSVGGTADRGPDGAEAWRAVAELLTNETGRIRDWLLRPPQTNEVGRGAALMGGLRHVCDETALPVRLVEVGTSAGLNLRADRFRIDGNGATHGDPASPVQLGAAWEGVPPPDSTIEVVSRRGGDLMPIDPTSASGELVLTAYVWPDQVERFARLRGAIELARGLSADVRAEPAIATLGATTLVDGTWTVLWHSVFQQYLDRPHRVELDAAIAALAADATPDRRFAHLSLEPERRAPDRDHEFLVTLTTWPGGARRILGTAAPHGIPAHWER